MGSVCWSAHPSFSFIACTFRKLVVWIGWPICCPKSSFDKWVLYVLAPILCFNMIFSLTLNCRYSANSKVVLSNITVQGIGLQKANPLCKIYLLLIQTYLPNRVEMPDWLPSFWRHLVDFTAASIILTLSCQIQSFKVTVAMKPLSTDPHSSISHLIPCKGKHWHNLQQLKKKHVFCT